MRATRLLLAALLAVPLVASTPAAQASLTSSMVPTVTPVGLAVPGGPVPFRVRVSNASTQVRTAPTRLTLNLFETTAAGDGWTCAFDRCTHPGPVAAGQALPDLLLTRQVPASQGTGSISLSVSVEEEGVLGTQWPRASAQAPVVKVSQVDLAVSASPGLEARAGGSAAVDVVVRNVGTVVRPGAVAVQLLREDGVPLAVPVTATADGWSCADTVCGHPGAPGPGLAPGASLPVLRAALGPLPVRPAELSPLSVTAFLRGPADLVASNDRAPVTLPVLPAVPYDLALSMGAGRPGTADVSVQNRGDGAAPGPVRVRTGEGASGTGWLCDPSGTCTYLLGVPAGEVLPTLTVPGGPGTAFAELVDSGDAQSGNDQAQGGFAVAGGPTTAAVDVVVDLRPGGSLDGFAATVRNVGAQAGSGPVTVALDGASGPAEGAGWTCAGGTCTHPGPVPALGALPPLSLSAFGGSLALSVAGGGDEDPRDNRASATRAPSRPPVALVSRVVAPEPALAGEASAFSVEVRHEGARPVDGALVSVSVAAGATVTGDGWTCLGVPALRSCSRPGPIAPGAQVPPLRVVQPSGSPRPGAVFASGSDVQPSQATSSSGGAAPRPVAYVSVDGPLVQADTRPVAVTVVNASPVPASGIALTLANAAFLWPQSTGAGPGWSCAGVLCRHAGPVGAYAALPPLVLQLRASDTGTGGQRTFGVQVGSAGADELVQTDVEVPVVRPAVVPPRVVAVSPGTRSGRAVTSLAFDRDVRGVSAATVQLRTARGSVVATTLTCYLVGVVPCQGPVRLVALRPVGGLDPGVLHRVVVTAGVSSLGAAGAPYAGPVFRSWAPAWSMAISPLRATVRPGSPVTLTAQATASPSVGVSGTRVQLWVRQQGQTRFVLARDLRADARGALRSVFRPARAFAWQARHLGPDGDVRAVSAVGVVAVR